VRRFTRGSPLPRRLQALLFLAVAVAASPLAAHGERGTFGDLGGALRGQPFELTADELEFESQRSLYVARGNVEIRQGERLLRADWVAFNATTGAGVASGSVQLIDGGDVVRADFVEFNIENFEGLIHDGVLESDDSQFRAHGDEIIKSGDRRYTFRNGVFTSCHCPDPEAREPWQIRASEVDVEIEGYGTARNTTVDVLGVPVVWFPWMIYPIKTLRQTGFLFPDVSLGSRNGFEVGLPFFWAASDQVNATLTPRWMSKRGFKADSELEYLYGDRSSGRISGAYAYDQYIDPDTPEDPFSRNRWGLLGDQDAFGPGGLRFQSDFRFVSDNEYPIDFDEMRGQLPDRFLQSVGFVGRDIGSSGRFGALAAARFADDMQNPDDQDRDQYLLQRLPEVYATALPAPLPWLSRILPSIDMDYTYFRPLGSAIAERPNASLGPDGRFLDTGVDSLPDAQERPTRTGPTDLVDPHRDNASLGGTEGDGLFEEGEPLLDEGSRLWMHPRVAVPFQLSALEVYPEVGWHQTFYDTRIGGFDERGFLTGRVDVRSRLRRRLGANLVHVLEPQIGYALVTAGSQGSNPLLVPGTAVPQQRLRTLDLDSVTRDSADRIPRANRVSFGVGNRFYGAAGEGGGRRLLADFTLLGLYEFEAQGFGDVVLDGRAYPVERTQARFNLSFDPNRARADEALAELTWRHPSGNGLSLSYRFLRDTPQVFENFGSGSRWKSFHDLGRVNQVDGSLRFAILKQWTLGYRIAYSFDQDLMIANRGSIEYMSRCKCWALGVELSEDRARGVEVKVLYRLVGLGREIGTTGAGFLDGP
jgi:lipopolysaccharide assembly outer membrane protein LptD (OstA)